MPVDTENKAPKRPESIERDGMWAQGWCYDVDEADAYMDWQAGINRDLLSELKAAHEIIRTMLNAMTTQQKCLVAKNLELRGISPDGMTRAHERDAVIARAEGK